MPGLKNGIPPPSPDIEVMVIVEPMENCVCGLKEPLVLCAHAGVVVDTSPTKAKRSSIPVVVDFVIFCVNFIS
jgi:hypothetical protein